jgi:diacylglycerol O-acyltransferase
VGGALRRWLEHRHGPLPDMRVRVPVSLHDPSGEDAAANRDSFMCLTLPLHEPDPARRLLAVNAQTKERKRHRDPQLLDDFFRDLGHGSRALRQVAERLAAAPRVFGLSVSNVPGPRDRMYVAGCPVRSLSSLSEIGEHHALRVAAISYAGTVTFGLCADPGAVEGVERMAAAIEDEVEALRSS